MKSYPVEKYLKSLKQVEPLPFPSLKSLGFKKTDAVFPERVIKQTLIAVYDKQRNFPAKNGTTRLSVHLRFGTVSIRKLVQVATKKNDTWLNELIWRDFYHMILWHFPHVVDSAFKPAYDRIQWRNNEEEFEAWCSGKTGISDCGRRHA